MKTTETETMKKPTVTEAKAVKRVKKTPKTVHVAKDSNEVRVAPTVATTPPYDKDAADYMCRKREGTFSLIHFIGEQVSRELAEILGRSITLPEAEHLVSLDGDPTICASEDVEFQPVKYLPFTPKGLKEKIDRGESLVDIQLPWGGAYYLTKDGKTIAYSGSVFHYNHRRQKYEWANNSPLVIVADEIGKRCGQRQWGVPFSEVDNILKARTAGTERRQRIGKMVTNIAPIRRPGLGRVSDAFKLAWHSDRGNGKPKRGYDRAKTRHEEKVVSGEAEE